MYTKTANRVHIHNLPQEAAHKIGVASFFISLHLFQQINHTPVGFIYFPPVELDVYVGYGVDAVP